MSVTPVLDVKDLTINYDNFPAVDNISFDVQQGDCLGIVGPNVLARLHYFEQFSDYSHFLAISNYLDLKIQSIIQSFR